MKPSNTTNARPLSLVRAVLGIFLPIALILLGMLGFVYSVEVRSEARIFETTEWRLIDSLQGLLAGKMPEVVADVRILANHHGCDEVQGFLLVRSRLMSAVKA